MLGYKAPRLEGMKSTGPLRCLLVKLNCSLIIGRAVCCCGHLQETVTFSALSVSVLRLNAFFRISQDSAFIFFLFTSSDRGTLFGTGGEADLM